MLERELLVANGLSIKQKSDGSIDMYKTRLHAKRHAQTCGIDYQEMSAPVAKMNPIKVLLSIAANLGWDVQQLYVNNDLLHGI